MAFNYNYSQIGIGTNNPDSSAALEVKSDNKGILLPRIQLQNTTDITTIVNPARGLMIYNLGTINDVIQNTIYIWNGSIWIPSNSSSGSGTVTNVTGSSPINVATGTTTPDISIDDASTTSKGVIQIAGDLSGTAAAPTIKNNAITTAKIADSSVTLVKLNDTSGTSGQVLTSAGTGNTPTWTTISSGNGTVTNVTGNSPINVATGTTTPDISIDDASTTSKGVIQIAGDLSGTAAAPTIKNNAITTAKIADGTILSSDLIDSGVTAGTYNSVTVDAKGLITTASQIPTTVSNTVTGNDIHTTVNGTVGADITIPNIYSSDGTLVGDRTVTMTDKNLIFDNTTGKIGIGTTPTNTLHIKGKTGSDPLKIEGIRDLDTTLNNANLILSPDGTIKKDNFPKFLDNMIYNAEGGTDFNFGTNGWLEDTSVIPKLDELIPNPDFDINESSFTTSSDGYYLFDIEYNIKINDANLDPFNGNYGYFWSYIGVKFGPADNIFINSSKLNILSGLRNSSESFSSYILFPNRFSVKII